MNITRSRVVSEEVAIAQLDALARLYDIPAHCYNESASENMPEFDALEWIALCAQLAALRQRQEESTSPRGEVSLPFRSIYKTKSSSQQTMPELKNTSGGLSKLAA